VEKLFAIVLGVGETQALLAYILSPLLTFGVLVLAAIVLRNIIKPLWKLLNGGR
jgi:hypothetical protein